MTPDAIAALIDRAERYARDEPELVACEPLERRRRLAVVMLRQLRRRGSLREAARND